MNDQQQASGGTGSVLGGSILDKIISSKEDQAKQEFNPQEVIVNLLKKLNSKEAEVLKARFGLGGQEKETLEAIGKRYEVTRERIRQIENLAISKIKKDSQFAEAIKPVEQVINSVLTEHGGVMNEDFLLDQLFGIAKNTEDNKRAIMFILSKLLDKSFAKVASQKKYNPGWRTKLASMESVDKIVEAVQKVCEEVQKPMALEEMLEKMPEELGLTENKLLAALEMSTAIDKNPFDEYGIAKWGSVKPSRMNDKIKLLLAKEKKPMHFVDLAKKITELFKKKAYPPTVHNELILNKEYVLVGRGIYALKEWGYKRGVVADVLENILREEGPQNRKDLVKKVLDRRMVKKNTIHLALTNKEKFKKLEDGRYTLVQ